jgi:hypothetical protein
MANLLRTLLQQTLNGNELISDWVNRNAEILQSRRPEKRYRIVWSKYDEYDSLFAPKFNARLSKFVTHLTFICKRKPEVSIGSTPMLSTVLKAPRYA